MASFIDSKTLSSSNKNVFEEELIDNVLQMIETDLGKYFRVYDNINGTQSLHCFFEPIKYRDKKTGELKDKDTTLIPSKLYPQSFQQKGNDINTIFPEVLSKTNTVMLISDKEHAIEFMYPCNSLSEGELNGNELLYENVFDENVNIKFTPKLNGFKELIIMNRYAGKYEYSYIIKTNGLKIVENDFSISIIDENDNIIFTVGEINIYDSAVIRNEALGNISLKTVIENDEYQIFISVDPEYLTDSKTVFPVYIDPLYQYFDSTRSVIYDTSVYSGYSNTNNYQYTSPYNPVGLHRDEFGEAKALIGFDLMALKNLPIKRVVSSQLYLIDSSGKTNTMYLKASQITSDWQHNTVTWNQANSLSKKIIQSSVKVQPSGGYTEINITSAAQSWINYMQTDGSMGVNPMNGIMLESTSTGVSSKHFRSAQYGTEDTSRLVITYELRGDYTTNDNSYYYIKNAYTNKYIDITGGGTSNGTDAIMYNFHGANNQKFRFNSNSDGTLRITPKHCSPGSVLDVTSGIVDIWTILTNCSCQKFSLIQQIDGSYYIKQGSFYMTGNSSTNAITMTASADGNKSKWYIEKYYAYFDPYYDDAFSVRYANNSDINSRNEINKFSYALRYIFAANFDMNMRFSTPQNYISIADRCKTISGLPINTTTINQPCPRTTGHNDCTGWTRSYEDFIANRSGTDTRTSALFTGNRLFNINNIQCNRSFSWYNYGITLQEITSGDYYQKMIPCVTHEMAHQYGAPDHYHEVLDNGECRGGDYCDNCSENSSLIRPGSCLMDNGWMVDILVKDPTLIFCAGCKLDMENELQTHH